VVPLEVGRSPHNDAYLHTKRDVMGHWLRLEGDPVGHGGTGQDEQGEDA